MSLTLALAVFLFCLTAELLVFSVPIVYEKYKVGICLEQIC